HGKQIFVALIGADGAFGDEQSFLSLVDRHAYPHEHARRQHLGLVVEHAARLHGPGGRIDAVVEEIDDALLREAALTDESDLHGNVESTYVAPLGEGALCTVALAYPQDGPFVHIEINVDRVHFHQRCERWGAWGSRLNEIAFGHARAAGAAIDGCDDAGELEV